MNRSHGDKKTDENDGLVARLKKGFQHLFNKRVMAPAAPLADTKEEVRSKMTAVQMQLKLSRRVPRFVRHPAVVSALWAMTDLRFFSI